MFLGLLIALATLLDVLFRENWALVLAALRKRPMGLISAKPAHAPRRQPRLLHAAAWTAHS